MLFMNLYKKYLYRFMEIIHFETFYRHFKLKFRKHLIIIFNQ